MERKLRIVIIISSFLYTCCYRHQLWNLNIEDAVSEISEKKISIGYTSYTELTYNVGEGYYIEVPQLQGGFYLYYYPYPSGSSYPILCHIKFRGRRDIDRREYIHDIERIYFYDDTFIVESNGLLYKVRYNSGEYFLVDNLEENIRKEYVFFPLQSDYILNDYGSGLFSFMNGERAIISGVYQFEIGLFGDGSGYHIWGESVYGFFDINVNTLEIFYPTDKTPYNDPIHFSNNIISKNYKEKINYKIRGRSKIEIYNEILY